MNIWNKVFLGLIFLLTLAALFFAAQEWKIRGMGQKAVLSLEKQQVDTEKQIAQISEGSAPDKAATEKTFEEMGLEESRLKLLELLFERKKAWFGCLPGGINPTGKTVAPEQLGGNNPATPGDALDPINLLEVQVTITGPLVAATGAEGEAAERVVAPPNDLLGVVYVFDEGDFLEAAKAETENGSGGSTADGISGGAQGIKGVGGSFLGIFTVDGAPQQTAEGYVVTLHSANELNDVEVARIQDAARSTWAIYASIPLDRYVDIFDRLSEEQANALLPDAVRQKLMDAQRIQVDFDVMLTRLYQERVNLLQEIGSSRTDIAALNASLAIAAQEDQKTRGDIEFEKKRIAAMNDQKEALQKMVEQYDASIRQLLDDIDATQKDNERFAAGIADAQLRVLQRIEDKAEQAAIEQSVE